jgi:tetratricopeptide (TPR) repeat protein
MKSYMKVEGKESYMKVEAKVRLEAHRKAVEVAEKLIRDAESPKVRPQQKEFFLGLALYQLQEYEGALKYLLTSFQMEETAETAARIAVCAWRMNDLEAAFTWIKRAIILDPKGSIETLIAQTKPTFHAILAHLQLISGKIESAAASAQSALAINQDDVAALYVLANTQLVSGDASSAAESLDHAIRVSPPFIADRLKRDRQLAENLVNANVSLRPFVADLSAVQRVIV